MNDLVSVVVPIYNVEKFLDKCINSIVNQTYKNLEIILVDDGSPDNCPEMCDNWAEKDSRIKVVHKVNAGLGMARNTGMENATGKYIFFFDSDDYVDETIVEKCVTRAVNDKSEVVMFGHIDAYDDGRLVERHIPTDKLTYNGDDVVNIVLPSLFSYSLGFGVSACKMFDLNVLKKHNIVFMSEREVISEDAFFSLELYPKINSVSIVPDGLYYYYKRSGSLSTSFKEDRQERNDLFLSKCLEFIEKENLPQVVATHIKARYHGNTLGAMMQIERSSLSRKIKREKLRKIFTNPLLVESLKPEVFALDHKFPRIFWRVLKTKCYFLCYLLLRLNRLI